MRVLFLTATSPVPPTTGARERDLELARVLAQSMDVEVVMLGSVPSPLHEPFRMLSAGQLRSRVRSLLTSPRVPYQVSRHTSRALRQFVARGSWDTVHASHVFTVPTALLAGVPIVMDAHNVETEVARTAIGMESSLARRGRLRWEARKTDWFEHRTVPEAAVVTATSATDAEHLRAYGARRTVVVPNGVDCAAITRQSLASGAGVIFVGSYDYLPNASAARELVNDVMPALRASVPGATLTLVGRRLPSSVAAQPPAWLHITGEVPDVGPALREARVTVMPIRGGGGTRLKVLRALATGVPVVSTPFGVAGLDLVPGVHVMLGDTPQQLAAQAERVIRDPALARRLAEDGRREVERRFDWRAVAQPLVAVHEELARGASPRATPNGTQ